MEDTSTHHDHGETWDRSDVRALTELRSEGLTYRQCAARLGRTLGAVRSKLHRLRHQER